MADAISVAIERCKGQMPDVLLGEHYGYYRHDDVAALVAEIMRLRTAMDEETDKRLARQANESAKASEDVWAVWGGE